MHADTPLGRSRLTAPVSGGRSLLGLLVLAATILLATPPPAAHAQAPALGGPTAFTALASGGDVRLHGAGTKGTVQPDGLAVVELTATNLGGAESAALTIEVQGLRPAATRLVTAHPQLGAAAGDRGWECSGLVCHYLERGADGAAQPIGLAAGGAIRAGLVVQAVGATVGGRVLGRALVRAGDGAPSGSVPVSLKVQRAAVAPFPALRVLQRPTELLRGATYTLEAMVTNLGGAELGSTGVEAPGDLGGAVRLERLLPSGVAARWSPDGLGWTCNAPGQGSAPTCVSTAAALASGESTPPLRLTFTVADDAPAQPSWRIMTRAWYPEGGRATETGYSAAADAHVRDVPGAARARAAGADPHVTLDWTGAPRAGGHTPLRLTLENEGRRTLRAGAAVRVALPRGARARSARGAWSCTVGAAPRCRLAEPIAPGHAARALTLDVALPRRSAGRDLRATALVAGRSAGPANEAVRDTAVARALAAAPLAVRAVPAQRVVLEDLTSLDAMGYRSDEHATQVGLTGTVLPADAAGVRIRWTQLCTTRRAVRNDRGCRGAIAPKVRWTGVRTLAQTTFAAPDVRRDTVLRFRFAATAGGGRASAVTAVRVIDEHDAVVPAKSVGRVHRRLHRTPKVKRGAHVRTARSKPAKRPKRATKTPGRSRGTAPARAGRAGRTASTRRAAPPGRAARAALAGARRGLTVRAARPTSRAAADDDYVSDAWCSLYARATKGGDDDGDVHKGINLTIGIFRFTGTVTVDGPSGCRADGAALNVKGDLVADAGNGPIVALAGVTGRIDREGTRIGVDDDTKLRLYAGDTPIELDVPSALKRAVEIPFPQSEGDEDDPLAPTGAITAQGFPLPLPGGWSGAVAIGFDTHEREEGIDDVALTVSATAVPAQGDGRISLYGQIGLGLNSTRELTDEEWGQLMEGVSGPGDWRLQARGTDVVSLADGCDVDLDGELSKSGDQPLQAQISGSLARPCAISRDVTAGRATVSWGTKDGLQVDGELTAQLPGLAEPIHGSISGRYESAGAWSLDVEVSPFTWRPAAGIDVTAGLKGTLSRADGKTLYALTTPFSITGLPGVDVANARLAVSNDCSTAVFADCQAGQLNVAAQADAVVRNGDALGLPKEIAIGGALNAGTGDFTLSARLQNWRYGSLVIHDAQVKLGVVGGKRQLAVDATADVGELAKGAHLSADLSTGLYLFTAKSTKAGGLQVDDLTLAYSASTPQTLTPAGRDEPVTIKAKTFIALGSVQPTGGLASALRSLSIAGSLDLTGEVGFDQGFSMKATLEVHPGGYVLGGADPSQMSLRWRKLALSVDVSVGGDSGANVTLSAGGSFVMHMPARAGEGQGQDLSLGLRGDISLGGSTGLSVGLEASLDSPWVNAFGWNGFTVTSFGIGIGVSNGVPTFGAHGEFGFSRQLADGLGATGDVATAFSLEVSPTKPCVAGSIGSPGGTQTVLDPGRKGILQVRYASVTVAPRGCGSQPARIGVAFDGAVMGTDVKIDASVTPNPFSIRGTAKIAAFSLGDGRLRMKETELALLVDPSESRYEFDLKGGLDVLDASVDVDAHFRAGGGAVSLDFDGSVRNVAIGPLKVPSARVQLAARYADGRVEHLGVKLSAEAELAGARLTGYKGTTTDPTADGPAVFELEYRGGGVDRVQSRVMVAGAWGSGFVAARVLGEVDYQPGRSLVVSAGGSLKVGSSSLAASLQYDSGAGTFAVQADLRMAGTECWGVIAWGLHVQSGCVNASFALAGSFVLAPSSWRLKADMTVDLSGRYRALGGLVDVEANVIRGRAGFEAANRPPISAYVDATILGIVDLTVSARIT